MRQRRVTDRQFAPGLAAPAPPRSSATPRCPVGEKLFAIRNDKINVVHLERPLDAALSSELDRATREGPFRNEHFFDSAPAGHAKLDAFVEASLAACAPDARSFVAEDTLRWARAFATLLEQRHVKVTLASVWSDSCRKFHADFVALRMLCTYVGDGTDYVSDEHVDREIDADPEDIEACNRELVRDPGAVHRCATGDILVLKGETFAGNRGYGAIHRSPPIEHKRARRLVLTIDELNPMLGEHVH
ncbi:MAG: DUF1826 domain-containing protein [Myxococcales bacterium]|nr:DUF1826 domain-containing protein [Myxococcales bacterium]